MRAGGNCSVVSESGRRRLCGGRREEEGKGNEGRVVVGVRPPLHLQVLYFTSARPEDVQEFASTSFVGSGFLTSKIQKLVIFTSTSSIGDALRVNILVRQYSSPHPPIQAKSQLDPEMTGIIVAMMNISTIRIMFPHTLLDLHYHDMIIFSAK